MKKLQILKALIDFIWILGCIPTALLLILFTVFVFTHPENLTVFFDFDSTAIDLSDIKAKLFIVLFIVLAYVALYCFYLFRKTLRYFQKVKPFHDDVIKHFYKIGYLLVSIGLTATVLITISRLVLLHKLKFSLGVYPYLSTICLGLFFMVLSEVFKVAKHAKEENELTV